MSLLEALVSFPAPDKGTINHIIDYGLPLKIQKESTDGQTTEEREVCELDKKFANDQLNMINRIEHHMLKDNFDFDDFAILATYNDVLSKVRTELEIRKFPYVVLASDRDWVNDYDHQKGKIAVSTIHMAKGCEWKMVFLF